MKMFKNSFWGIMKKADWEHEDSQNILEPVITFLANHDDEYIFAFHDVMSQLLYNIDREESAQPMIDDGSYNDDDFLYQRCFALTNGNKFYHDIVDGIKELDGDFQFKPLLNIPKKAWAKRNNTTMIDYPHTPKYPIQSKSNKKYWS